MTRVEQSFRDIAELVKLRGRKDAEADIFKLVHDWLRDQRNGPWLLIVDNADDAAVLSQSSYGSHGTHTPWASSGQNLRRRDLSEYLPPSSHGSILVTSRTRHAAVQIVEDGEIIQVEPMQDEAAQALLLKKLRDEVDINDVAELASALEYIPLALNQAAAYIKQRAPRCSVRQYLDEYRRSDKDKTSLLNQGAKHLREDDETRNSIITTWQMSFEHVRRTRESAAELLSLMSFFDRQGIQEFLLHDRYKSSGHQEPERKIGRLGFKRRLRKAFATGTRDSILSQEVQGNDLPSTINEEEFEDDIRVLRDYSFVTVTKDVNTFEMHRLVQLATQQWLTDHDQLDRWRARFIANLCAEFPSGHFETWAKCQLLFPHAKAAVAERPKSKREFENWAKIANNAAWYLMERGMLDEAHKISALSMEAHTAISSKITRSMLDAMHISSMMKGSRGEYKEAEEQLSEVVKQRIMLLGKEHPDTLRSMSQLALTYHNQGRWKEAEELEVKVLEITQKILGKEHPNTLMSMIYLASTYREQGWREEAEKLQVEVLTINSKILGKEHPISFITMSNLALTYRDQGRLKEAEELGREAIAIQRRVRGEEHPGTVTSIHNLAYTLKKQGQDEEAVELMERVVKVSRRTIGVDNPRTTRALETLGVWRQETYVDSN